MNSSPLAFLLQGAALGSSAATTPGSRQTLLISSLLGFDLRGYRDRLDQAPACLNVLDFKDPVRARLMVFNDVSHYVDQPGCSSARLSKWWDVEKQ